MLDFSEVLLHVAVYAIYLAISVILQFAQDTICMIRAYVPRHLCHDEYAARHGDFDGSGDELRQGHLERNQRAREK